MFQISGTENAGMRHRKKVIMSRRSSFGYSSYSSHSYRSGGYRGRRNRNKKKKIIIAVIIAVVVLAAAAFAVWFFFLNHGNQESADSQSSGQTSGQESSGTKESSAETESSQESSSESSVEESSEQPDIKGYFDENVFMYDKQGYEMFYGTDEGAVQYAEIVSGIKKTLGKDINVYNMVVPTHAAFGLPEKYQAQMSDEKTNIEKIYSSYSEDVIPVDVYAAEDQHKNEYTYFRTDSNWTGLGAYYAYQEFCKVTKTNAVDISTLSKGSISGFAGSLYVATKTDANPKGNQELAANKDTVIYYNMPGVDSCYLLENGKQEEQEVPLIASFAEGSNAYSAFIWGNNPYMTVKTTQKTGKKLCIIKDSFGCAFAPFTVANYDEIYIVDPRYYEGNVLDYIKKNKFTDVLVLNSVMNANTEIRMKEMKTILS